MTDVVIIYFLLLLSPPPLFLSLPSWPAPTRCAPWYELSSTHSLFLLRGSFSCHHCSVGVRLWALWSVWGQLEQLLTQNNQQTWLNSLRCQSVSIRFYELLVHTQVNWSFFLSCRSSVLPPVLSGTKPNFEGITEPMLQHCAHFFTFGYVYRSSFWMNFALMCMTCRKWQSCH